MLCDKTLALLWSLLVRMRINLDLIGFKDTFCVYMSPIMTINL